MGNPIGTIRDLSLKLASGQGRAHYWYQEFRGELAPLIAGEPGSFARYQQFERTWKALALICDSYDEWGQERGYDAVNALAGKL